MLVGNKMKTYVVELERNLQLVRVDAYNMERLDGDLVFYNKCYEVVAAFSKGSWSVVLSS